MVKRTFCPPKECYDPKLNADGKYGRPLPPFSELIEAGKVCALNFPVSLNPGLAKAIGVMMKLDFQRAMLNRIPRSRPTPSSTSGRSSSSATSISTSPPSARTTRAATRSSSPCPARPSASPSLPPKASAPCARRLPGETWRTLLADLPHQDLPRPVRRVLAPRSPANCAGRKTSGRSTTTSPRAGTMPA